MHNKPILTISCVCLHNTYIILCILVYIIIGQFWDTPVEIQEVSGKQAKTGRQYKVVIYSPFTGPREFIGDYYPMTWDYQKTPCLYAGTRNGVPVIEGKFTQYEVKYLFDPKFDYSQFSQDRCSN